MKNPFASSEGLTPTEKILARLANETFLEPWSYPNLYKKKGDELCDLLVVFENSMIVFSDKSCVYPCSDNPKQDWSRWYRRSIEKSAKQIRRAEGWLKRHPDRVYLDSKCTRHMPVSIPVAGSKIYRVCLTFNGPPLGYYYTPNMARLEPGFPPHAIGPIDSEDGWIHVLDGEDLPPLLKELSTVRDFVSYLDTKERAINDCSLLFAASELGLLAYYIYHGRTLPASQFGLCLLWDLREWESLLQHPDHERRSALDQYSFVWDDLIVRLIDEYKGAELEIGNNLDIHSFEKMLAFMNREERFARRCLSRWIYERLQRVHDSHSQADGPYTAASALPSSDHEDLIYVLLVTPGSTKDAHREHRKQRYQELVLRCYAAKARFPERRYILGVAMDSSNGRGGSEDFVLLDTQYWAAEELHLAERTGAEFGFFAGTPGRFIEDEYPAR